MAERLARAHTTAGARLSSPELQTATQDLASAYTALAAAAAGGDADAFAEAAEDVEAGERELAAAEIAPDGR